MALPMKQAKANPPLKDFYRAPLSFMVAHFKKTRQPDPSGAYKYAFTTFGAQQLSIVGAGTGLAHQGVVPFQRPFVSVPVATVNGIGGYPAGQMTNTPLSANPH